MDHRRAQELVLTGIDFELARADQGELSSHLAGCRACATFAGTVRQEAAELTQLAWAQPPDRIRRMLSDAMERRTKPPRPQLIMGARSAEELVPQRRPAVLRMALLAAALAAMLVALAVLGFAAGSRPLALVDVTPPSPAPPAAWMTAGSTIRAVVPVCQGASGLTPADDSLWFTCGGSLWKLAVSPQGELSGARGPIGRSGYRVIGPLAGGVQATASQSGEVVALSGGELLSLDAVTGAVLRRTTVPGASAVAWGADGIWIVETGSQTIVRLDPTTDSVDETIPLGSHPSGIVVADGSVWVSNAGADTITEIDAATNRVMRTVPTGRQPGAIVASGDAVWVANAGDGSITRVDTATGSVSTVWFGGGRGRSEPGGFAVQAGREIWAVDDATETLDRVDAATGQIVQRLQLPGFTLTNTLNGLGPIAAFADRLWVVDAPANLLLEVDTNSPS